MLILFIACGDQEGNQPPDSVRISFVEDFVLAGQPLEFQIDNTPVDPDGDKVIYQTTWYVNDEVQIEYTDETKIPEGIVLGGQKWNVEVVASDGKLQSDPATVEIEITNTFPTVEISGSEATVANTDMAWKINIEDPDQQDVGVEVEILVNNDSVSTENQNISFPYQEIDVSLSSENYVKGDEVQLTIRMDDSFGEIEELKTFTVGNLEPEMLDVFLSEGSVLQPPIATLSAQDLDEDIVVFQYQWYENSEVSGSGGEISGELQLEETNVYQVDIEIPTGFQKGDTWSVSVTPFDGESNGFASSSNEIIIGNSAPSVSDGQILPENIYADSQVTCSAISFDDVDGDDVSFDYIWYSNGIEIGQGVELSLVGTSLVQGDELVCEMIPSDAEGTGASIEVLTVISNTTPQVQNVAISIQGGEAGTIEDSLECSFEVLDIDGDATTQSISWYQNGNLVEGENDIILSLTSMTKQDEIYCSVSSTDSIDTSSDVVSESFIIVNSIPYISSPGVQLSPTTITSTDVVLCNYDGYFDADINDTDQSQIEWLDSTNNVFATTLALDIQNSFATEGDLLKCRVTPYDGEDYGAPLIKPFIVQNATPLVSIELSTDTIYTDSELSVSIDASDVENDLFTLLIEWLVDGTLVKETSDYIEGVTEIDDYVDSLDGEFYFNKGEEVLVRVTITQVDDTTIYRQVESDIFVVQNSNPPSPNVRFEPMNPFPGELVKCIFDGDEPVDIDGDELTYEVHWYQNDELFEGVGTMTSNFLLPDWVDGEQSNVTNGILLNGVISLSTEWRCIMTVTDVDGGSNEGSFSFDICPLGQYEDCLASSCDEIKEAGYDLTLMPSDFKPTHNYDALLDPDPTDNRLINGPFDGRYWIDLPENGPTEVYCDMNTDDGGWTHLLTTSSDAPDFLAGGTGWFNEGEDITEEELRVYDANAGDQTLQPPTYGLLESNEIRLCYGFIFPENVGDIFPEQQCYSFSLGYVDPLDMDQKITRSLQSFFVEDETHIDCSKGNEIYGIPDENLEEATQNCEGVDHFAGRMNDFSNFPNNRNCYWLGINHQSEGNFTLGSTNSALGLLYSTAETCEYNPSFVGNTYGIGLGLVVPPQNNQYYNNWKLWHVFGR
jgi:hypothetical protein